MRDRSVRLALVRLVGLGHAEAVLDSDADGLGPVVDVHDRLTGAGLGLG